MKKIILIASFLLLSACTTQVSKSDAKPTAANPNLQATESKSENKGLENKQNNKMYDLTEISKHSSKDDCWLAIESKVYDATKFIASQNHPGGDAILSGCGKNATELFNTRPMGSKTPHSSQAKENLANFYIGELSR